ncbi:MAG: transglutaminase-like domain-containing protein [Tepidanaerobacteraceae bacterium]|jgi:transglutaminase-like putative cysteine protease|nr:transglutaminase-like domain-containing protein [Tepidanaerobacteraceae bacterium]
MSIASLAANLPEDIQNLVTYGDFKGAARLIDLKLKKNIGDMLKDRLIFEKERLKRLEKEYIYSFEEALKLASSEIRDFTGEELELLRDEGYADWAFINGRLRFHRRFLENIKKTLPGVKGRLINPLQDPDKESVFLDSTVKSIIENGKKAYRIHVKTGVKLKKEAERPGETVRVYLPIPAAEKGIKNIKILNTSHKPAFISPDYHQSRTIYFEEELKGGDMFTVEYSFENHVCFTKLDYNEAKAEQPDFYTDELLPHIAFTPYLKNLAETIVGNEKNPLKKARMIYDYITLNVKYSFVRSYSTILNIPEYAALNLKGDCGVQALLFITLCRICGVPARWQSGLYINPYHIGCHDWAQFYIEPYGWLYADPSFGGGALRAGNQEQWNFYFGNIDPFRMPANSEFQQEFTPKKAFLRSDPYDNQEGEIEYKDGNVYSTEFDSIMEIIDIHEIQI